MKNGDMPATPCQSLGQGGLPDEFMFHGLTKREEFASRQMAALQCAARGLITDQSGIDHLADIALKQADALLAAIEKEDS